MRHNRSVNHLGRTAPHRKAMMSNMVSSLILHKRIETTVAKAKAVKPLIERLITKAKSDTMHSRRVVFSYLQNKFSTKELFGTVAEKVANRPGGYTRILKTGTRMGDNAEMCVFELVDFNEFYQGASGKKAAAKKSRRGGGAAKTKKQSEAPAATEATETSAEETSAE